MGPANDGRAHPYVSNPRPFGDDVAGRLLALLGARPDALHSPEGAARQLGISTARVHRALDELAAAHLIEARRSDSGGHLLPAFVREYAAELVAQR